MIIRSLEVENFRKFRDTLRIEGFTDGLNIVVEPNEKGKSTLLEALRAAFFIRYSAKTELVRSYVPIGDDVAPRVTVGFELEGQPWTLEKQFMRSPSVRLTGGTGRRESDAAEDALQDLLGFERGNNRGNDNEARGPLGMLWVEQASALAVESPNRIVRDTVRGVLEAEVGAVTGGRRFDAIRANVESAYAALRTPATGKSKGDLAVAEARFNEAAAERQRAEARLRDYEQALNDLDAAKARLRLVERDLVDPQIADARRTLEDDQKLAESASLRSAAAEAQHGHAEEVAKTAAARLEQLVSVETRIGEATSARNFSLASRDAAQAAVDAASVEERRLRAQLDAARTERAAHEKALSVARGRARAFALAAGARRALDARQALANLEVRKQALLLDAALVIDGEDLDDVARLEREQVAALARLEAGSVKVDLKLADGVSVRIDGMVTETSSVDILSATRFDIDDLGALIVRPPQGSGRSIEADLAAATDALASRLRTIGIVSHADGIARNERAASAGRELRSVQSQIAAACPGDPTIGLAQGADALRSFVAGLDGIEADPAPPQDDMAELEKAMTGATLAETTAAATHEEARSALSKGESALAGASADLASATRELETAVEARDVQLKDDDRVTLDAAHAAAQRDRAAKLDALETAREGARAFDLASIKRRIENLDRAARRASDERLELTRRIATLEANVVREGTAGPAGRVADSEEEEDAALVACDRLRREADTLETLRKALAQAANDASRTFLAPVTKRAARYVERLLPGCGLSFDEELGLAGVSRFGVDESCGDLSRGTQEQLAILTRLAFAELLLEDGAPISLILDDPLVYSDDARLETMTDILQDASQRMQVILLTCRTKAFRHVDGNRIVLP